ncbi:hypothetical protein [Mycolicibacterium fluoranthenivorans]|uniref:Uncharacterized protein n=1 Tax=Mycolicibacterium fluoranthenivorans TaxID=258505 RepID=A0A1G4VFS4_9MYCO|nr:hypothetical protein [Mycolicibacterium fluoranthenivorans]SCX06111.1 hypothetical protein SAMN02799620_00814 [Mycolicibacterium fluoranthenivorans]
MTVTEQLYAITEHGKGCAAVSPTGACIALAGPYDSDYHPAGCWLVMLGFEAAKSIGAANHERFATFVVRDEEEARQWLGILARMYFAHPADRS